MCRIYLAQGSPDWFDGKNIDEYEFCKDFLQEYPMKYLRDRLITVEGIVEDEMLVSQLILEKISKCVTTRLDKKVSSLLSTLKTKAYNKDPLPVEQDRIHVANGTYFLDTKQFSPKKDFCNNRLRVSYCPNAPEPKQWLHFLEGLLYPEDIPTLQEYLGYCLIPATRAQQMLILVGKGGEGKSRIGVVMRSMFGDNMNTSSLRKVETSKFSRADLEYKLLMVDDDLDINALPKTNYIKSIVTAETKIDIERKGKQSYQALLYARFLCFGNGTLTAIRDHSDGFYRRQIILTTKDKPAERVDDPYLSEKLIAEQEGILLWCLEGLHRLLANNYHFSLSDRAKENVAAAIRDANNIVSFMKSTGYVQFTPDGEAATCDLYTVYKEWCEDNAETLLSKKAFSNYLSQYGESYGLWASNNIYIGRGKRCRGYEGIQVLTGPM